MGNTYLADAAQLHPSQFLIDRARLDTLKVHPEVRGLGLSKSRVFELLRRMYFLHLSYATVSGDADNPDRPERLYRRCGFTG